MPDDKNEINAAIDAISKLTENIPIYQDLVQPAAKELGKNLGTTAKLITVVLSPVRGLIWGYEQIEEYLTQTLKEKLNKTPAENIVPPPTIIAGPVFESIRFCSDEIDLREMFSNLLANSMDSESMHMAHPAFVGIIKNLSTDEAKILKYITRNHRITAYPAIDQAAHFASNNGQTIIARHVSSIGQSAGCDSLSLTSIYLDNLIRLGILSESNGALVMGEKYSEIEKSTIYINNVKEIEQMSSHLSEIVTHDPIKKAIIITDFGRTFMDICVKEKNA